MDFSDERTWRRVEYVLKLPVRLTGVEPIASFAHSKFARPELYSLLLKTLPSHSGDTIAPTTCYSWK